MATRDLAQNSRASSNLPSTVVRLPTAASRRPENNRFAAQRAAGTALRMCAPWPGEYIAPWQRERESRAKEMSNLGITKTPELCLILALLATFTKEQQAAVKSKVEEMVHRCDDTATAAAYLLICEVAK